jgi:transposase
MRRAAEVALTVEQRAELETIMRAGTSPQRTVRRAQVVLLAAKGLTNQRIARRMSMGINAVGKWRSRYAQSGLAGLIRDRPGRGRKPRIDAATIEQIVKKTTTETPPGRTQWSQTSMAKATGLSESTIGRIWKAHGLKPHRVETFKVSRDPHFADKLEDIVGLYLNPPQNAVVFSVDEKSQIQALDRTQPGLPMKRGRADTMTHDYKRNGTTTLFAALNVLTGEVTGVCHPNHTHLQWLKFLKHIERQVHGNKQVHVICDNYATHKHEKVERWLARHPRFVMHFTPTSASWLNMVERFFRDLTVNAIRRGVFTSVQSLIEAIDEYLIDHNRDPKPFIWTANARDILAKVMRAQVALQARLRLASA